MKPIFAGHRIGKIDKTFGVRIRSYGMLSRPGKAYDPAVDDRGIRSHVPRLWKERISLKILCEQSSEENDWAIAKRLKLLRIIL